MELLPESALRLETEIINRWEQDNPEAAEAIRIHCGKHKRRELYHACFQGLVLAALHGDYKKLDGCAKVLANRQQALQPEQTICLLQMIIGMKNAIKSTLGQELGHDFTASLENCVDRLVLSYGKDLLWQLGRQKARMNRKDKLLSRRNWELRALNRSSTGIISTLDVQQVLESILEQVGEIMFTDTCAIYELDQA
jgi:hypothetical protein